MSSSNWHWQVKSIIKLIDKSFNFITIKHLRDEKQKAKNIEHQHIEIKQTRSIDQQISTKKSKRWDRLSSSDWINNI